MRVIKLKVVIFGLLLGVFGVSNVWADEMIVVGNDDQAKEVPLASIPGFADDDIGADVGRAIQIIQGLNDRKFGVSSSVETTSTGDERFLLSLEFYGFQFDREPGVQRRFFEVSVSAAHSKDGGVPESRISVKPFTLVTNTDEAFRNHGIGEVVYERDLDLGKKHSLTVKAYSFELDGEHICNNDLRVIAKVALSLLGFTYNVPFFDNNNSQFQYDTISKYAMYIGGANIEAGLAKPLGDNVIFRAVVFVKGHNDYGSLTQGELGGRISLSNEKATLSPFDIEVFAQGGVRGGAWWDDDANEFDIKYSYFLVGVGGKF